MARDRSPRTEGSLLVLVLLVLACGLLLAFLAKTREGVPSDAVNLNTASPDDLALALQADPALVDGVVEWRKRHSFGQVRDILAVPVPVAADVAARARTALSSGTVDPNSLDALHLHRTLNLPLPVAQRVADYRATLPGGAFRHPLDVLNVPAVDSRSLVALGPRAIVRSPAQVYWWFAVLAGLLLLVVLVSPIILRRAGVGGDPYLVPLTYLLAGLGVVELFSISDPLRDSPTYMHHMAGILVGTVALWLAAGVRLLGMDLRVESRRRLRRYTYVWALAAIALLVGLRLFGFGPEGVRLTLGFFQPVEVIKILLVLFVAGYLAERGDLLADSLRRWRPPLPSKLVARSRGIPLPRWSDAGPIVTMFAAAFLMLLVVRDMGPALLLFGAFVCTLYLATGRPGIAAMGLALAALGGVLAYVGHVGVVPVRVQMWLSPWDNRWPNGMQLGQALWAFASGGWSGTGLGLGAPGSMPVVKSDLIFAALGEELGLVGGLAVLALFLALVWRGLRIALRTQNDFDRLLAFGLTSLMACQVFLITAGVTGLLPLTGITLPFVAYGNSSLVASLFMVGLLRGISSPTGSVPVGPPRPLLERATYRFAIACVVGLGVLVGVGRLLWVQTVAADRTAGHGLRTPDRDRVVREKLNPRLLAIARTIERGSVYDRRGRVLATSRLAELTKELQDDPGRARRLFVARQRYYPLGAYCAHVVGYLDAAYGGPVGVEKDFDRDLRGFRDYADLLRDYRAKDMPGYRPRKGRDVVLTLDATLQEVAGRILRQKAGALTDARTGKPKERAAMVALDPATGETIVSTAIPSFDPNMLAPDKWRALLANADKTHRLVDRARSGLYPPGSTLKVATAGAGLEEGVTPVYDCNHVAFNLRWTYKGHVYARRQLQDDVGEEPHNIIRMPRAVRVSCNLYFANLGMVLGPERLYHAFADKDRWALRGVKPLAMFAEDLPDNAFGQGTMLVTPTEMARVAGAVANQGRMMQPTVWKEVREAGPNGAVVRRCPPVTMSRPLGVDNARLLADMMRGVVTDGTAKGVFEDIPVQVAGKTGTAQNEQADKQPHSWFIGYAPFSRPRVAFSCIIENGGYGKRVSAPAIHDLLREMYGR